MKKKLTWPIIILFAVALIFSAALYLQQSKPTFKKSSNTPDSSYGSQSDLQTGSNADQGKVLPETKTFDIIANNFSFSADEISVKLGDTVKIVLESQEGLHDLVIDEFNVATKRLESGEVDSIQFVADKSGRFEYYCSVGTHRQMGMKGTLIVSP